jgi:hypothetical protein
MPTNDGNLQYMASGLAVLLVLGLVTMIGVGAVAVLSPTSSGQTVTDIPSQAADNLEDIASDIVGEQLPQDSDSDGISDGQEVETGTDPSNSDTDGDGLTDKEENEMSTSPNDKDSDRDGLGDSKEQDYGTDPRNRDTDGDGIDDGEEVTQGTNPTNPNTDGDRYRDNEDSDPLSKESAEVKITVSDLELQENYNALEDSDSGSALATVTVDMVVKNDGDDYASFVKFDGVFLMDGIELKRVTKDAGRVNAGEWLDKHITFTLDVSDIPAGAKSEIARSIDENILPVISFEIRNVAYEKF